MLAEGTQSFDINASKYTHQYKDDWIAKGYADGGCTIDFRLEGSASSYSSITGETITIAPIPGTYYGSHDLQIVAYYSASIFETSPPATPTLTKSVDIQVSRNAGIEEWPMYTITALGALLLV